MNKADLITVAVNAAAQKGRTIQKGDAEILLNSFLETIRDEVVNDRKVGLMGFGTFSRGTRAARNGVNPSTKETIFIEAKNTVKFKPSKLFLD